MQLTDLRALIRLTVTDATSWPNATVDAWIAAAIRLYSAQFPRVWRYTLALVTGTQAYALPGGHGFQGIVSVEYPSGEDPPEFLAEVPEWSDEFGSEDEVYALRGIGDTTATNVDTAAGTIVFAETVATGESAVITYLGCHPLPAAGDDDAQITVPRAHLEAITAYCEFAAHWEKETDEAAAIADNSITVAQLGEESRRAWIRYKEVMDRLAWLGQPVAPGQVYVRWGDIGL